MPDMLYIHPNGDVCPDHHTEQWHQTDCCYYYYGAQGECRHPIDYGELVDERDVERHPPVRARRHAELVRRAYSCAEATLGRPELAEVQEWLAGWREWLRRWRSRVIEPSTAGMAEWNVRAYALTRSRVREARQVRRTIAARLAREAVES